MTKDSLVFIRCVCSCAWWRAVWAALRGRACHQCEQRAPLVTQWLDEATGRWRDIDE